MKTTTLCNITDVRNISDLDTYLPVGYQEGIENSTISLFFGIRVEAFIGLSFSVFGVAAAIIYKGLNPSNFYIGLIAFVSLLLAGLVYWTAVGRFIMVMYRVYYLCNISLWTSSQVSIPYTLIAGFLVGILNICAAVGLLSIILRNHTHKGSKYHRGWMEPAFEEL